MNGRQLTFALCAWAMICTAAPASQVEPQSLQVEYRSTPLGIDVTQPRFSWRMQASASERGVAQSAYEIQVKDAAGAIVWDSNKVASSRALAIVYAGSPLKAATRYSWTVSVWDSKGSESKAASWFETGLMDPNPESSEWSGAQGIGGGNDDLVLYSPYLAIFDLEYKLTIPSGSTRASFVYGANDSRLLDKNKNIYQVQAARDHTYIKLELDMSSVDESGGQARLNVYRAGYKNTDSETKPFAVFEISREIINSANRNAEHAIGLTSLFGNITILIDGKDGLSNVATKNSGPPPANPFLRPPAPNSVNLNPAGRGGDFLPFGMLCEMGFAVDAGQSAVFSDVSVRNNRMPRNVLFHEDLSKDTYNGIFSRFSGAGLSIASGAYHVSGGARGLFAVSDPSRNSMPMLRAVFDTKGKPVASARLYVTARGIYELMLNGKRVGDDYYNPGLTQYNVTHFYQTYDVMPLIKPGANAIGAMLGEGWWSGLLSFGSNWNHFGDRQSLRAKLVVNYKDGSATTVITSPQSWKYFASGPLRYSSMDFGEIYDSSRENAVEGWATARFDDRAWKQATAVPLEGTTFSGEESRGFGAPPASFDFSKLSLIGQIGNAAGVFRVLTAQSVKEVRPGVYVYDLGQNIVGVPRISIANGHAGEKVTLRYAEILYPNLAESGQNVGMLMTENYRAALSQDVYTMKAGSQTFQPRFTSRGFQYVEITGIDKALPLTAVEGIAISSIRALSADYKTSSEKVNKLWSNLTWSNVDNFLTIPTDCPQRNERMGWSGDISVFSPTATYLSNADQFLTRHMYALRDVQLASGRFTDVAPVGGGFGGLLWGSAGIVVPWEAYQQYDDLALLEQNYPAMAAYLNYVESTIDPKTGLSSDALLGDWLGPQNNALGTDYLATAYHAYDLGIMAKVAQLLGKSDEAAQYQRLYEKRKAFFNATFINTEKKALGTAGGFPRMAAPKAAPEFKVADTQTAYAVGLAMNLFSDENKPAMIENLAAAVARENKDDGGITRPKYSLMTGFIGTSWIGAALSDSGHSEAAYRLLENEQYPSWLYAVDQGATSIWERLNGYTVENGFGGNNSMNSFNHYSFGAVGRWMLAYSLGIQRDEPGFQKFILQPEPDPSGGITFAEGHYDSMYGRITSAWKLSGNTLRYQATVPPNTSATLYLPAGSAESVKESGVAAAKARGIEFVKFADGKAIYRLQSGSYEFTSTL